MVTDETLRAITSLARPNRFTVDLSAIGQNLREIRSYVGASTWLCPALKADAYGFGLVPVARVVVDNGGDAVAVADIGDAARLRDAGVTCPILLYAGNLPTAETVRTITELGLMPTLVDSESAKHYASLAAGRKIEAFIKIDVGLERIGIQVDAAVGTVREISAIPDIDLRGIYTHMHVTEGPNAVDYAKWQFARFQSALEAIEKAGFAVPIRMAAASAVLAMTSKMTLNAVDPGHILYGLRPPGPQFVSLDLRSPFASLHSCLIQIKPLERNAYIEELGFPLRDKMRVGIIPMGRRDGLQTLNSGRVLVRGVECAILGGVSLEHTRVDLTDVPDASVGDIVVIIGRQGGKVIELDDVAIFQQITMPVALALSVRESVPREYKT